MQQASLHPSNVNHFGPGLSCPSPRSLLTPANPVDEKVLELVVCFRTGMYANLPEEERSYYLFPGRECPEPLGTQTLVTMSLVSSTLPSPTRHFLPSQKPASLLLLCSAQENPEYSSPPPCKPGQHLLLDCCLSIVSTHSCLLIYSIVILQATVCPSLPTGLPPSSLAPSIHLLSHFKNHSLAIHSLNISRVTHVYWELRKAPGRRQ